MKQATCLQSVQTQLGHLDWCASPSLPAPRIQDNLLPFESESTGRPSCHVDTPLSTVYAATLSPFALYRSLPQPPQVPSSHRANPDFRGDRCKPLSLKTSLAWAVTARVIGVESKKRSYQYACTLMKPEYRKDVSEQYKKKIENIVRKPPPEVDQRDALEASLPCMYCGFNFAESQLDCLNCKNISPFCIASGMRMLKEDWSNCPACNFPARYSVFSAMLQANEQCPMCDAVVKPEELVLV
ncbi:Wdr19, partial [Symbiodinium sp. CCMP2592]